MRIEDILDIDKSGTREMRSIVIFEEERSLISKIVKEALTGKPLASGSNARFYFMNHPKKLLEEGYLVLTDFEIGKLKWENSSRVTRWPALCGKCALPAEGGMYMATGNLHYGSCGTLMCLEEHPETNVVILSEGAYTALICAFGGEAKKRSDSIEK